MGGESEKMSERRLFVVGEEGEGGVEGGVRAMVSTVALVVNFNAENATRS